MEHIKDKCSISDCKESNYCKSYCNKHYLRLWKYGSPDLIKKAWNKQLEECKVEECSKKPYSRNYCVKHYNRFLKYGDATVKANCGTSIIKHGMSYTPTYKTWSAMKDRCNNPSNPNFNRYGGRGIKVCSEWNSNFAKFYEYMGDRPDGMSIERIDVNGNYEPGNVKWADAQEQAENKRNTPLRHRYK